jgi:protein TonB
MAYLDRTQDPRRRAIGAAGTLIIQGLIGYVVLVGLAEHFRPQPAHPPTIGSNFPLPTPTPTPTQTPTAQRTADPLPRFPLPPNPPPLPPIDNGPTVDRGPSGGTGTVDLPPLPPPPPPRPAFLAKGPSPIGSPATWALTDDYPLRDLEEEHEGITGFRVTVGADGRVSTCTVTRSSGFRGLDAAACSAVKKRARFSPATDDSGQKIAGTYSNSVRWQIPR